jgi:hypothetical protein
MIRFPLKPGQQESGSFGHPWKAKRSLENLAQELPGDRLESLEWGKIQPFVPQGISLDTIKPGRGPVGESTTVSDVGKLFDQLWKPYEVRLAP